MDLVPGSGRPSATRGSGSSLAHASGFVPYVAMRFAELAGLFRPDLPDPDRLLASFRRFYFDTALSSGAALPTLEAFADRGPSDLTAG